MGRARACSIWLMKDWHQQGGWELPSSQIGSRAPIGQHQGTWGVTAGQPLGASCSPHSPSWEGGGFSSCGNLSVASRVCCLEHAVTSHFPSHAPLCKGDEDPLYGEAPRGTRGHVPERSQFKLENINSGGGSWGAPLRKVNSQGQRPAVSTAAETLGGGASQEWR